MFESNTETFDVGQQAVQSMQEYIIDHHVTAKPVSLQEQINQYSKERSDLQKLGAEWSHLGRLLKKSKKVQRKEFKRLVSEAQIPLDLR